MDFFNSYVKLQEGIVYMNIFERGVQIYDGEIQLLLGSLSFQTPCSQQPRTQAVLETMAIDKEGQASLKKWEKRLVPNFIP